MEAFELPVSLDFKDQDLIPSKAESVFNSLSYDPIADRLDDYTKGFPRYYNSLSAYVFNVYKGDEMVARYLWDAHPGGFYYTNFTYKTYGLYLELMAIYTLELHEGDECHVEYMNIEYDDLERPSEPDLGEKIFSFGVSQDRKTLVKVSPSRESLPEDPPWEVEGTFMLERISGVDIIAELPVEDYARYSKELWGEDKKTWAPHWNRFLERAYHEPGIVYDDVTTEPTSILSLASS